MALNVQDWWPPPLVPRSSLLASPLGLATLRLFPLGLATLRLAPLHRPLALLPPLEIRHF